MSNLKSLDNTNTNNNINFTNDQKNAIDKIVDFIAKPFNSANHIIGLTGAGGTGKTFIINYILKNCKYSDSVIACTSPTHKACRVFSQALNGKDVNTIQSTFGFRLDLRLEDFNPKQPQFNPMATPKLDNIKLLLIDEASMLPAKLVTYICNKCKELSIKIIFIGDSSQLPPVNENKSIAFLRCGEVCKLNEIVRQSSTNPITDLLVLLRNDIKNKTYTFLEYLSRHRGEYSYNEFGEGFTICSPEKFKEIIDLSFSNEEYTKNIDMYRIVAYTNTCVTSWNNYIRNSIIKDSDKAIVTKNDLIMSYETIVNEFLETIINNSEEYIINDIVNFTDATYGFKGFLVKFQLVHGGKITKPLFIIDHKDRFSIQKYIQVIEDLVSDAKKATGGTRAAKWKKYFDFKKKYLLATNIINRSGQILYSRDLDYGFAITSHKSQGSTYDNVFVDVNNMVFDVNGKPYVGIDDMLRRLYVACSRSRKNLILCYGV